MLDKYSVELMLAEQIDHFWKMRIFGIRFIQIFIRFLFRMRRIVMPKNHFLFESVWHISEQWFRVYNEINVCLITDFNSSSNLLSGTKFHTYNATQKHYTFL